MRTLIACAIGLSAAAAVACYWKARKRKSKYVLVVGSINVDLYQRTQGGAVKFAGKRMDVTPIKGMTLPASSFVANAKVRRSLSSSAISTANTNHRPNPLCVSLFDSKAGEHSSPCCYSDRIAERRQLQG